MDADLAVTADIWRKEELAGVGEYELLVFALLTSDRQRDPTIRKSDDVFEIGYWVRTDRHGRGYATEAARLLTSMALEHFAGARRIQIRTDQANTASSAIPPKIGYPLCATGRWDRDLSPGESGIELTWVIERSTSR